MRDGAGRYANRRVNALAAPRACQAGPGGGAHFRRIFAGRKPLRSGRCPSLTAAVANRHPTGVERRAGVTHLRCGRGRLAVCELRPAASPGGALRWCSTAQPLLLPLPAAVVPL